MKTITTRLGAAAVLAVVLTAPVRANAPAGRYTVSGGTVYDTKTKLTWQQTAPTATYTWANAQTYCSSATVSAALGGSGWRLPTVKELATIVDYSRLSPGIDQNYFSGTQSGYYWSSSPLAGSSSDAWGVDFRNGSASSGGVPSTSYVRCVR